jgi:Rrf2 family protein
MISPTAEYALRAVVAIAHAEGGVMITPDIADMTKVPPGYLSKILQTIRKAGLVESRRGPGGGFILNRPPDQISLLDVVNAVEPLKRIERCPLGIESHGANLCPLHRRLDQAAASVQQTFAATTIAELINVAGMTTPLCQPAKPFQMKISP